MSLPGCGNYGCGGNMVGVPFEYPSEDPTTLHKRRCSVCGQVKTFDVYEVGTMVSKDRLKSLDNQMKRFMKALLDGPS